jgi:RNA polymerase sigma-70 factor, ECF subfamily
VGHFGAKSHLPLMTDIAVQDAAGTDATVRLAAGGDQAAFTELVRRHHRAMVQVAYAITGDLESARDAAQSAWSIAWHRLGSVRQPELVRSWLVSIAANEARQAVRRRGRATIVDISGVDPGAGGDPSDAISALDLARVLRGLNADDRALLALRFVAGLDSTEIANHLGMSASGVRSRLSRLLDRLRRDLDHD